MPITRKSGAIKTGQIVFYGHIASYTGFLACDGSLKNIAAYPRLAAKLGTTYGGDGVTTFGLPEMRGEGLRGLDQGRGVDVGRVLGAAQAGQLSSHTHDATGVSRWGSDGIHQPGIFSGSAGDSSFGEVGTTAAAGGTNNGGENRMRNMAFPFFIKT